MTITKEELHGFSKHRNLEKNHKRLKKLPGKTVKRDRKLRLRSLHSPPNQPATGELRSTEESVDADLFEGIHRSGRQAQALLSCPIYVKIASAILARDTILLEAISLAIVRTAWLWKLWTTSWCMLVLDKRQWARDFGGVMETHGA